MASALQGVAQQRALLMPAWRRCTSHKAGLSNTLPVVVVFFVFIYTFFFSFFASFSPNGDVQHPWNMGTIIL